MWQRSYAVIDKPHFLDGGFNSILCLYLRTSRSPTARGGYICQIWQTELLDNVVLLPEREYVIRPNIPEFYRIYRTARPTARTFIHSSLFAHPINIGCFTTSTVKFIQKIRENVFHRNRHWYINRRLSDTAVRTVLSSTTFNDGSSSV